MFVKLSENCIKKQKISLDNLFIQEYMPYAPDIAVRTYLYGLSLAYTGQDNSIDIIAGALRVPADEILSAYKYWENQGLVSLISIEPPLVEYKEVVPASEQIKHYDTNKFSGFNKQLHALLMDKDTKKSRHISMSEYKEYYYAIEHLHIEEAAVLAIIAYCVRLKGINVNCSYIMTVARNLLSENVKTFDKVNERLTELDLHEKEISAVLNILGRKQINANDKSLWLKWKKDWGFSTEVVVQIAKRQKKGGMEYLDKILEGLHGQKLFEIAAIDNHMQVIDKLFDMTKGILKVLGMKMEDIRYATEIYTQKWLGMGFDEELLMDLAKDCAKKNKRNLEYMNTVLLDWKKRGITNLEEGLKLKPPKDNYPDISTKQKSIGRVTQKSIEELDSLFDKINPEDI